MYRVFLTGALSVLILGCGAVVDSQVASRTPIPVGAVSANVRKILDDAKRQTKVTSGYTQEYFEIAYPNGDVPEHTGACTDVVVRAFRAVGVDLQKEVHEDMTEHFSRYPTKWGLTGPDPNIDHRRVPNLQTFFDRRGKSLAVSTKPADFKPGDIVTWDLDGKGMTHIGLVADVADPKTGRPFIYHNIGSGARLEDRLFEWTITGHYRYFPAK